LQDTQIFLLQPLAMAETSQYSPFQQELLRNLCQINTNVSSLIKVFAKFQENVLAMNHRRVDELAVPHLSQSTSSVTPQTKEPKTPQCNAKSSRTQQDQLSPMPARRSFLQQSKSMPHDLKPLQVHTIQEGHHEPEYATPGDTPTAAKHSDTAFRQSSGGNADHEDEPVLMSRSEVLVDDPVLSLDSGDEDDRNSVGLPIDHREMTMRHHQLTHAKSCRNSSKYDDKQISSLLKRAAAVSTRMSPTHSGQRHKSSSATATSSASMAALLRANQYRGKGVRGKKRSSMFDRSGRAPVFNPEHVLLRSNNRVSINVGGNRFQTTLNTLVADQSSMLSAMFSGRFKLEQDENGAIFIDRDPTHFRHILNFLRDGIEYLKHGGLLQQPEAIVNELLQEAKFYNIRPLVDYIQLQQTRKNKKRGDELTHEKQYKLIAHIKLEELEAVFNKYTGSAGYDFEEWLYVSPWKTSRSSTTAPFFVMLFSKKLSRAEVRLLDRLTNIDFQ